MVGVVLVILTVLFAGPMVLGTFAAAERLTDQAQTMWFRVLTMLFALAAVVGLVTLVTTPA
jgi:hypothetical protein